MDPKFSGSERLIINEEDSKNEIIQPSAEHCSKWLQKTDFSAAEIESITDSESIADTESTNDTESKADKLFILEKREQNVTELVPVPSGNINSRVDAPGNVFGSIRVNESDNVYLGNVSNVNLNFYIKNGDTSSIEVEKKILELTKRILPNIPVLNNHNVKSNEEASNTEDEANISDVNNHNVKSNEMNKEEASNIEVEENNPDINNHNVKSNEMNKEEASNIEVEENNPDINNHNVKSNEEEVSNTDVEKNIPDINNPNVKSNEKNNEETSNKEVEENVPDISKANEKKKIQKASFWSLKSLKKFVEEVLFCKDKELVELFCKDENTNPSPPLTIVSRQSWLAQNEIKFEKFEGLPKFVIICHTCTESCSTMAENVSLLQNIQHLDMHSFNCCDIRYNFLIGEDSNVYEGRGWKRVGEHTLDLNKYSLGIAFVGCYMTKRPPTKSIVALTTLLDYAVKENYLAPDYQLVGHCQFQPSDSPGASLYEYLKNHPRWESNPVKPS